jgi:hypothetical protein
LLRLWPERHEERLGVRVKIGERRTRGIGAAEGTRRVGVVHVEGSVLIHEEVVREPAEKRTDRVPEDAGNQTSSE